MMLYLTLFWVYLEIGLFGFGGGYAMLPLIQNEVVVRHRWLSPEEFTDMVAISQMTPGPIGINTATYVGYKVTGSIWGAIVTTIAVSLPSLLLVVAISYCFTRFRQNRYVDAAFRGIRPASVGLIAAAALLLTFQPGFVSHLIHPNPEGRQLSDFFVTDNFIDWKSILLFMGAFVITIKGWLHPILTIIVAGVFGYLLY